MARTRTVRRDKRITVERAAVAQDDYGEEIETWAPLFDDPRFAAIYYGRGQERRQAAAEQGDQSATFNLRSSPDTRGIKIRDRFVLGGEIWDIVGISPIDRTEIDFTAVRAN